MELGIPPQVITMITSAIGIFVHNTWKRKCSEDLEDENKIKQQMTTDDEHATSSSTPWYLRWNFFWMDNLQWPGDGAEGWERGKILLRC